MIINVENISPNRIAYIRQIGPYGLGNIQGMEVCSFYCQAYSRGCKTGLGRNFPKAFCRKLSA